MNFVFFLSEAHFYMIRLYAYNLDPTYAGIFKEISTSDTPIWWEDVENFKDFEKLLFLIYNKVSNVNKVGLGSKAIKL